MIGQPTPVDLTNFREITGDDPSLTRSLFLAFLESSEENIAVLERALISHDDMLWVRRAHSFKGEAKNLGAIQLADACHKAQISAAADFRKKQEIFREISTQYGSVRDFLRQMI